MLNKELLDLIIQTSSNEGDLVLDCFMGSGVTCLEAYKLGRRWIGIDQSEYAIEIFEKEYGRLDNNLFVDKKYRSVKI